jgi:hypothetical protein
MSEYRITTPVRDFTGDVGGCSFAKGVYTGPVEPGPLHYFRSAGYGVEEVVADTAAADEVEQGDDDGDPATAPRGNASADAWREHVLALGATEEQVDGLNRDQLRELAATLAEQKGQEQ